MNQAERRRYLIDALMGELPASERRQITVPTDTGGQRALLRALMNVRPPAPIGPETLAVQDAYLQARLAERGPVTDADALPYHNRMSLWRGDITLLTADGIVNAANNQMLGCFAPGHSCIDNAIHTYAGMQLRQVCNDLMLKQGHAEEAGEAKITPAFNLPARYVLHTVGPIVDDHRPTPRHRLQLASCYRSCLQAATAHRLRTLAFCCISTGAFGYPPRDAACVAIDTVRTYLAESDPNLKVVFNVFLASDELIYQELLEEYR